MKGIKVVGELILSHEDHYDIVIEYMLRNCIPEWVINSLVDCGQLEFGYWFEDDNPEFNSVQRDYFGSR